MKFSTTTLIASLALFASSANGFTVKRTGTVSSMPTASKKISVPQQQGLEASSMTMDEKNMRISTSPTKTVDQSIVDEMNGDRFKTGQPRIDVILEDDYFVALALLAVAPMVAGLWPAEANGTPSLFGTAGCCFHILLSGLVGFQTRRVRGVFEDDAFEFYNLRGKGLDLKNGESYLEKSRAILSWTEKIDGGTRKLRDTDFFLPDTCP